MAEIKYVSLSNLNYYDGKIKEHIANADETLKTNLEGQVEVVANALDDEITRSKAAEATNAAAAASAQEDVDALTEKVGAVPEGSTVMGIITNIQESAYDDTEVRGLIFDLNANKADKTQVATDIADAVKAEEDARKEAVAGVQGAVDTLSGTHTTDKKALEDAIALKADQTALDAVSEVANAAATKTALQEEVTRATGEETRIEGLVTAEVARATKAEEDLEARIETMEVFWDTTEDADGVVNKLKEIQDYIASDETGAATMAGNIQENAQAISAMDTAYKAADATLQGNIDKLAETVDTKADASDVEALAGRVTDAEGEIDTLQTDLNTAEEAIAALQEAVGNGGSVADMIADAVAAEKAEREAADAEVQADADKGIADAAAALKAAQDASAHADELNTAMDTRVKNLETDSATHALKSEVETVAGRVTTLETDMTQAKSDIDAVEALAAANDAAIKANASAIALKADATALNAVSDRVGVLETWHNNFKEASEEDINNLFV